MTPKEDIKGRQEFPLGLRSARALQRAVGDVSENVGTKVRGPWPLLVVAGDSLPGQLTELEGHKAISNEGLGTLLDPGLKLESIG